MRDARSHEVGDKSFFSHIVINQLTFSEPLGTVLEMDDTAPWEHIEQWGDAREQILQVLEEAIHIRDGVVDALDHPHDDAMGVGVVFYIRWKGTLRDLSKIRPELEVVHFQRAVFSICGVPLRLYRAYAEDEPPARVLDISKQERRAIQMTMMPLWGEADEHSQELDELPDPTQRLRLRIIPDEDNRIAEFLFEELDDDGEVTWEWAIRAEQVPVVLADASTHTREPVRQDSPKVSLRLVDDAADDPAGDAEG